MSNLGDLLAQLQLDLDSELDSLRAPVAVSTAAVPLPEATPPRPQLLPQLTAFAALNLPSLGPRPTSLSATSSTASARSSVAATGGYSAPILANGKNGDEEDDEHLPLGTLSRTASTSSPMHRARVLRAAAAIGGGGGASPSSPPAPTPRHTAQQQQDEQEEDAVPLGVVGGRRWPDSVASSPVTSAPASPAASSRGVQRQPSAGVSRRPPAVASTTPAATTVTAPASRHQAPSLSSSSQNAAPALAPAKKLHTRIHIDYGDGTPLVAMPSQPVAVASTTPALDIVEYLVAQLDLAGGSNENAENNQIGDQWCLYEVFDATLELGNALHRPIRPWEPLGEVLKSWGDSTTTAGSSSSYAAAIPASAFDGTTAAAHRLVLKRDSAAAQAAEYALLATPSPLAGHVHWETRPGHFKHRYAELRLGAEAAVSRAAGAEFAAPGTLTSAIEVTQVSDVASVWVGRPREGAAAALSKRKPADLLCSLAHFDIYELTDKRRKQPTKFPLALRNEGRLAMFEEKTEYVKFLYADTAQERAAWVAALRAAKAHVDRFLHPEWFGEAPTPLSPVAHAHHQAHRSYNDDDAAAADDVNDDGAAAYAAPTTLTRGRGGPLVDVSAPTHESLHHGTTVAPTGRDGKPLLDFSENLAGFTLARPTLLGSTHLPLSATTSPNPGSPLQSPTGGGSTLLRRVTATRRSPAAAAAAASVRGRAAGGDEQPAAWAAPYDAPSSPGSGGLVAATARDDNAPLGMVSLSRRRSTSGSAAAGAAAAAASMARSRSKSRHRPAAGALLGGVLPEAEVGGTGTLLDRIDGRRAQQQQQQQQRRGLIDMIPTGRR
ncbi:hypothetical protein BC828DRAFT_436915 [Blastocladiella britannica]|nr:hypothetical protein BC828DRAFT_436915 [Blastocladiella britannica]